MLLFMPAEAGSVFPTREFLKRHLREIPSIMSATLPFNHWVSGETTTHKDIGAVYYNTGLSMAEASIVQNAVMTIYLRVLMDPIGGSEKIKDVDDTDMAIKDWNAATGEFQAFKAESKEQAESFWNDNNDNTVCMVPAQVLQGAELANR